MLADAPKDEGTAAQFQLTSPMKVNNRQNLAAYITVDSDPGPNYGKMTVYKLPTGSVVAGPEQIYNSFTTTAAISKDITLLSSGGSTVIHGNLLTLPIGNSFLYVEPLYVQGSTGTGYPVLQRILVAYGDKIGYAATLSDALANLNQDQVGQSLNIGQTTGPSSSPTTSAPTTPPSSSSSTSSTPASTATQLLTQINAALTKLQQDFKNGDLAATGQDQADILRLTTQYLALTGTSPSSGAPSSSRASSSPSPSVTPTK